MDQRINVLLYALLFSLVSCSSDRARSAMGTPNIVFIMSDDHAYQAVSAYRSDLIETPNIDKIAHQGILFQNAFVSNSICAPSRAVILSGMFSHLNGVTGNSQVFDGSLQTFPKILQQNGYQTSMIGKWHLKSPPTGFDYYNVLPGQGDYYNPDFIEQGKDTIYRGYVTEIITELSLEWMENRAKSKPFLLMMHHKAPHRSWMPALKNLELFDDQEMPLPQNFYDDYEGREALKQQQLTVKDHMDIRMDYKVPCDTCDTVSVNFWAPEEYQRRLERLSPEELQLWDKAYEKEEQEFNEVKDDEARFDQWKYRRYMEDYLRCIVSVDESVGQVLDFLEAKGLDENTLVVYTSDQGFYLGEHGLFDKRFMYEEAMRTPLMVRFPGEIEAQSLSGHLVQNLDIAPTLLDVAGISPPEEFQGRSMRGLWQEEDANWRDALYYHYYEKGFGATPHYGIRTHRYKLIHYYDGVDSWEFFDLETDPMEMNNLFSDAAYAEMIQELKAKLKELQAKYKDPIE